MNDDDCSVCGKPILDDPGPAVMDRAGKRYHFRCWSRLVDIQTQETRDSIDKVRDATGRRRDGPTKKRKNADPEIENPPPPSPSEGPATG